MMNCEQVTRSVSDFPERELRFRDRMAILMHLAMCGGCRNYFEQMRLTILGLRSLKQPGEPGPPVDALLERHQDEIGRNDGTR